MAKALSEGRRAIEIYPKNVPQRNNVGLYAMYAGQFETAIAEAWEQGRALTADEAVRLALGSLG